MIPRRAVHLLVVGALLVGAPLFSAAAEDKAPPPRALVPERLEALEKAFDTLVEEKRVAGAVVLVARDDETAFVESFGRKSRGAPMTEDTIFRIYSMSKPITAVAAMILVEEDKLALEDSITKYLPEFEALRVVGKTENEGKPDRPATVRDLLQQTAGFSYGFGVSAVDLEYRDKQVLASPDLGAMIDTLATIPLQYEPGTRWHYSVAKDVLGRVVEVAADEPYDEFLRSRIFEPLEMSDTGFHVPEDKLERFASVYGPNGRTGSLRVVDRPTTSKFARPATLFSGGGGLVSTAADYLRFCRMLERGGELDGTRILSKETVAEMTRNQLAGELLPMRFSGLPMPETGFGLGVSVRMTDEASPENGEYGWAGAASTGFTISPKERLIVITMVQLMPFDASRHQTAKRLVYEALPPAQPVPDDG